ncbi:MAG: hypothetical protein Q9188_003134 [Gyalolechia gomerana]
MPAIEEHLLLPFRTLYERWSKNTSYGPHQWHNGEGSRLQFLLRNQLGDRGSEYGNITITRSSQRPCYNRRGEVPGEAKQQASQDNTYHARKDDRFPSESIWRPTLENTSSRLALEEDSRSDASPSTDFVIGDMEALDHLR